MTSASVIDAALVIVAVYCIAALGALAVAAV